MAYTNLLTNGNFDTDTSGWSVVGGSTLTRTTSSPTPQNGAGCLRVTKTATSGTGVVLTTAIALDTATTNPAYPTLYYVFSGYVQVADIGQATTINVYIRWYSDAGTTLIGSTVRNVNNLYAGRGWVSFNVTDPMPTGATYAKVEVSELGDPTTGSNPISGEYFYVDNLSFYELDQDTKTSIIHKSIAAVPLSVSNLQLTGPKLKSDITLGSLVLNTLDAFSTVWVCTDIQGWWGTSDLELPDIPRGLDDGSYEAYGRWTTRTLQLLGSIVPPNADNLDRTRGELTRQINLITQGAWLIVDEVPFGDTNYPKGVSKASWVHLSAKPTMNVKNARGRLDFDIPLRANDPIKYHWNWDDPLGYSAIDASVSPIAYSTSLTIAASGNKTVTNIGNYRVGGKFTLTGAASAGTKITFSGDNAGTAITQNITLATALVSTNVLVIDTYLRQVLISTDSGSTFSTTNARAYLNVDIDWAKLYPGNTLITNNTTASLKVQYRSGWVG